MKYFLQLKWLKSISIIFRAFEIACHDDAMRAMQAFQDMSMFLGTHNHARTSLKTALDAIPGYEEILCDLYDMCRARIESKTYILHKEKYVMLKVNQESMF